jgi:hypothetical protein
MYRALAGVMLGLSSLSIVYEEFVSLPGHGNGGLGALETLQAIFTCAPDKTSGRCLPSFSYIGQGDTLPAATSLLLGALRFVVVRTIPASKEPRC